MRRFSYSVTAWRHVPVISAQHASSLCQWDTIFPTTKLLPTCPFFESSTECSSRMPTSTTAHVSPISRVVSVHYYCQARPTDQRCASLSRKAESKDFLDFAQHWGNYGLIMQFALAFVKSGDIIPEETWRAEGKGDICEHNFVRGKPEGCPGWYRFKLFVEGQSVCVAPNPDG